MLTESSIPSDKIFFHGSKFNQQILKINPPSPENIFFVTADIDYADMYAIDDNSGSNIYVVSLNPNAKVFVPWNYSDSKLLDYPESVKELLSFENHYQDPIDIFNRFVDAAIMAKTFRKFHMNWQEIFYGYVNDIGMDYEREREVMLQFETVKYFDKRFPGIFEKEDAGRELRKIFCEDLKKQGFQMFATQEMAHSKSSEKIGRYGDRSYSREKGKEFTTANSNICYGIFDVSGLDSLIPIPLKKTTVELVAAKLRKNYDEYDKRHDWNKDYSESNAILKVFLDEYRKTVLKKENLENELRIKEKSFNVGDKVKVVDNIRCIQKGKIGTIVETPKGFPEYTKHGWKNFYVKFDNPKYGTVSFQSGTINKIN